MGPKDVGLFDGIEYICTGGSEARIEKFAKMAKKWKKETGNEHDKPLKNLASGGRYVMYKVGNILAVNHGMGIGSASIMINEILKLVYYCRLQNVKIIRMGSSGGLGVKPGTLIITKSALSPLLEPFYNLVECGKERKLPA